MAAKIPKGRICPYLYVGSVSVGLSRPSGRTYPVLLGFPEVRPNPAVSDFLSSLTRGGPYGPRLRAELQMLRPNLLRPNANAADLMVGYGTHLIHVQYSIRKLVWIVEDSSTIIH